MNATQIDKVTNREDRGVGEVLLRTETGEQRVIDFYRTIGSPYFGAVVSACDMNASTSRSSCWPGMEPRPTVVTLLGELNISTVPLLRQCFAHIEGDIDVDCSGLDYVDAQGLGIFVSASARCARADAKFVLVEPSGALSRLLQITGLDTRLEVRSSVLVQ
jgi:anti-anti-sigma factor